MKISSTNKLKSQLWKVFWITVVWTAFALFQFVIGYGIVMELNCGFGDLSPMDFFNGSLLTGILAGLLGGGSLVFIWEKWLRSKNYGVALFHMFLSYCIIYFLVAIPNSIYYLSSKFDVPFFDDVVLRGVVDEVFNLDQFQSFFIWLIVVLCTLIVLQVGDKYGPGVFLSFILGKYFQPTREERIFMFLDLRSSTTIAERLGEVRYFQFIKNVFKDVTPAIIYSRGEIYQYVGDEIVVSWKMEKGFKDANCLQCFFNVQSALKEQAEQYAKNFDGIQPEFKAGLHYGFVMVGEVGVVKRDIAYSGDVLNTAARIQSKCNELGVNVLISKDLLVGLGALPDPIKSRAIGEMDLRGKQDSVMLYTLEMN